MGFLKLDDKVLLCVVTSVVSWNVDWERAAVDAWMMVRDGRGTQVLEVSAYGRGSLHSGSLCI